MKTSLTSEIFDALKLAMKAQGMTYRELGEAIHLSEPSIKRIFAERDCKMGRIIRICEVLNITLADLVEASNRANDETMQLSPQIEAAMAASPGLFSFYLLMREKLPTEEIKSLYGLEDKDIAFYGHELEKLGLARVHGMADIRLIDKRPIRFQQDGPLQKILIEMNQKFLSLLFQRPEQESDAICNLSRRMRPETARYICHELETLSERITKLARQDRLVSRDEDLVTMKLLLGFGEADYPALVHVPPFSLKDKIRP